MSKVNKELLGELLKDQRIRMGYSLEDLAEKIEGVNSRQTVHNWENGSLPMHTKWRAIEEALGLIPGSMHNFVYGDSNDLPATQITASDHSIASHVGRDQIIGQQPQQPTQPQKQFKSESHRFLSNLVKDIDEGLANELIQLILSRK